MNNSNIKLYLGISFALIILLVLVILIPFSSKNPTTNNLQPTTSFLPSPTSIVNSGQNNSQISQPPIAIPAHFTGVVEETIAPEIINLASQKKDLRSKVPVNLGTFSIDFDYSQDKFVVTLTEPKAQSQKNFEAWKTNNYSALGSEQFLLK